MNDLFRFEALPDIPYPEEDATTKQSRHNSKNAKNRIER